MDLSKYDTTKFASEGRPLHLRGPDGAPVMGDDGKPVIFTLLGADCKEYQRRRHALAADRLERREERGGRTSLEEIEADAIELHAAATKGWTDNWSIEGEKYPCTPENARMIYTRFPWIRDQVDRFVADRTKYLGES